jgi:dipeptidyl aminopeptidase/acylaminoacyl peptidase
MALGGMFGCALLTGLVTVAYILITSLTATPPNPTQRIVDTAPTPITETPATVIPTAAAIPPTNTVSAPVGARATPTLDPALPDALRGALVYYSEREGNFDLYRLTLPDRVETRLTDDPGIDISPAVSPNGEQIAFISDRDGDFDLYLMNRDGGEVRQVVDNDVTDRAPTWSPDGEWIAFSSDPRGDGTHDLLRVHPNGTELQGVFSDGARNTSPRYSPDGRYLIFTGGAPTDGATWEIMRLNVETGDVISLTTNDIKDWSPTLLPDGDVLYSTEGEGHGLIATMTIDGGGSTLIYDGAGYEWGAAASPDGSLIAFTSDVTGQDEVYVIPVDGGDAQQLTSTGAQAADWTDGS